LGVFRNSACVPQAISAIVPTYNRAQFLAHTLDSLLSQTLPLHELIVVDDGSVDSTREILDRFEDRIQVIHKTNGGKASALNVGLKAAKGEFIWIFDDDDEAAPDCLEKLFGALTEHPECGFSYGRYDHLIETPGREARIVDPDLRIDRSIDFKLSVLERCYIFQQGMLVRRSVFDAVGPFNETMVRSQDYEMLLRITRQFKGIAVDSIVFHYRQHSGVRGLRSASIAKGQIVASWIKYDDLIFSKVYETYLLSEFLPAHCGDQLSTEETRYALLERSCIMARKALWTQAAADLKEFVALVQSSASVEISEPERKILQRFFGPYSYADSKLAESDALFNILGEIGSRRLRHTFAAELLAPIAGELGYGIRRGYVRYVLGTSRKCVLFVSKYLAARRRHRGVIAVMRRMESR
jgi:glycosyltransferase involved in cell wall biosynthesis